ncbi:response regulator transcription factor [Streptomyces sp. NPDC020298]|uniref:response regulator transcription factor n=1 Tax=unclassified Streptomyces TaxID=2593676 RepID=UPI0033D0212E
MPPSPDPNPTPPLRIVVADDNPVVRAGLTALLSGREDTTVVAEAANGHEACDAARRHRPDVVLLDVRMPELDGLAALPHLVPLAPVIMLTYSHESETIREAVRLGASGYLVHGEFTVEELVTAVRDIRTGREHFTATAAGVLAARRLPLRHATAHVAAQLAAIPSQITPQNLSQVQSYVGQSTRSRFRLSTREAEIMDLIATGMNNQQIAAACFISEKTVKNHINRIFAKLHSTSRSQAAAKWLGVA